MVLEYLNGPRADKLHLQFLIFESLGRPLVIKVLGQECKVPYMLGSVLLKLLFFANPGERFRKPSSSRVAELWGLLVKHVPQGDQIEFPYDFGGSQRVHWTLLSSSFCSGKHLFLPESGETGGEENLTPSCLDGFPTDTLLKCDKALIWLSCRYRELCLFHHIQETANQVTQKSTPDVNLVYCILIILRISMANDKLENSLVACDDSRKKNVIKDHVDRRRRVRVALWIYASIIISKIPSWTNFWENLPWSIDIFRESGFLKRFSDSLDTFDVEGCKASTSAFNSKKTVFQRLSFLDQLPPHENDPEDQDFIEKLWARILTNTPEGVEQLRYVLSDNSSGSTDGVAQYELDEAGRVFLPKTEEDQKAAIHKVFDILLSLRKIPIDRDEVVEHEAFQWLVSVIEVFQLRLGLGDHENSTSTGQSAHGPATARHHMHPPIPSRPELREYMRTPKCIRASKRWKELAHVLGDGILLTGKGDNNIHCFLDIATVVECGQDAEFSRLKRLLQAKGSWLKSICAKLSGLVQALRELPYPTQDLERTRDFCRQVHIATSDIIGEAVLPDIDDSSDRRLVSMYLLLVRHGFMPSRSEVSERHRITWDILAESIDQTRTDILEGKVTLEDTCLDPSNGLSGALEEVVERFMARYVDTLGEDTRDRGDAEVDMETRISLAMATGFILFARDKGLVPGLPEDLTSTSLFESVFAD
ncbi:hypothetical protein B0J15DRAFT_592105 [Fusarium solani]|uniref:Uncharacterized protein n=1 Tax=Fusarium solani TaxID=169388 RepID=A0A9P9KU93_FUSSL|nr:uncharacterized protein B0J15DRAFT_592105 [Fusarium solani]KAH7268579.1 hypothetical protein B0J15DRAFT_592105 [Fusarium solani]